MMVGVCDQKMKIFALLFFFFRPYPWLSFFLISIFSLSSVLEAFSIATIYPLLNTILMGTPTAMIEGQGKLLRMLDSLVALVPISDSVVASCTVVLVITFLNHLFGFIVDALGRFYHLKFREIFYNRVFKIIFEKPYAYFLAKKQGELVYLGLNCAQAVGEIFHYTPRTIVEVLRVFFILILLMTISWKATIGVGVIVMLMGGMYHLFSSKVTYPYGLKIQQVTEQYTALFAEVITGIKQIKIFQNLAHFSSEFAGMIHRDRQYYTVNLIVAEIPSRIVRAFSIIGVLAVVIVIRTKMPGSFKEILPLIVIFMMSIQRMMPSLLTAGSNWIGLKELAPRLEVIKNAVTETTLNQQIMPSLNCPPIKKAIRFENVSFKYAGGSQKNVLSDVTFEIPIQKMTALVGPSGAGKSTIVDILSRIYRPDSGRILADGEDLEAYSDESWTKRLAILSQDPFLFHFSVRENIRLGRMDATDEEIIEAAKLANAHEFILSLSEGYDTVLGDRGVNLSGGQKQRVALAKALLRKPDILIMDEATSALDNLSEKVFQENLTKLHYKMTIFMIAHRMTTIERADQIIVMNDGRVAEVGTHAELLLNRGLYASLYMKQK